MTFLNPWLLLGAGGIGIAVLIHLLSRYRHKRLDWAAMHLLRRAVRVRTRRLRLEDLLLLLLRCLAILLVALALARPTGRNLDFLGEPGAGMAVILDGSLSMTQEVGGRSRFSRGVDHVRSILGTANAGNPVSVLLMGESPRVLLRNAAYQPERTNPVLEELKPLPETANLGASLEEAAALLERMRAPNKELYIVTDAQKRDWTQLSDKSTQLLESLADEHRVFILPVRDDASENLAVTDLKVRSGALRRGEIVRLNARIRNAGQGPRAAVQVLLEQQGRTAAQSVVNRIPAGAAVSVPFFLRLSEAGPMRLAARINTDDLQADNRHHTVVDVKERVRVLVVDGNPFDAQRGGAADYIATALSPPGSMEVGSLSVTTVPWLRLPSVSMRNYELVILANVPDIPEVTAEGLHAFVEGGGGLIVFLGGNVRPDVLNERMSRNGESLLPGRLGSIEGALRARDGGRKIDLRLSDHPIANVLSSLPPDTIAGSRFGTVVTVEPSPGSRAIVNLSDGTPLLLEKSVGRGTVLLCTSSAGRDWSNFALNPSFPLLLHEAVTHLLRSPHEGAARVGDQAVLPLVQTPVGTPLTVTDPQGESTAVQASLRDGGVVLNIERLDQLGFYSVERDGGRQWPLAVNPDPGESDIRTSARVELAGALGDLPVELVAEEQSIAQVIRQSRQGRELWRHLLVAALIVLLIESLVARHSVKHPKV
mgnify:CR=1 FL=1